ncbi:MAG: hypothetical protein ACR2JF_16105 [Iamia sp.]
MDHPAGDDGDGPGGQPEPAAARDPRPAPAARPTMGPGRRAPQANRGDYTGCALWAGGFLVLVIISFTVGVILRPDSDTTDGSEAVTLASSVAGDDAYEIVGRSDEIGDPCVTLRRDGEEVTGQCGSALDIDEPTRYKVTSTVLEDGTTLVFGPVPGQTEQVRLRLEDGSEPVVDVRRSQTAGFPWFALETDQDIDGPAEMLDGNGDPLRPG